MTTTKWVNFKSLREKVGFAQVLQDYGIEIKIKGDQHQGFCPLPGHQGNKRSPSFSVNLSRNIFQCFGCGAKGNVIEFTAYMEKLDPQDPVEFRKAALLLQQRYCDEEPEKRVEKERRSEKGAQPDAEPKTPEKKEDEREHLVNVPLDFELKGLDPAHPYLKERGLTEKTIQCFGLGYSNRGLMKGRIAIPLQDDEGRLIGYAGRLVDEDAIDADHPKYKFPGSRERDDSVHDFAKSLFLFNGYRVQCPVENLIVVEGFFGALWLHQCGYPNVVALMGSSCSERQTELMVNLLKSSGCLWIMPDRDPAGDRCAVDVLTHVAPHRAVRWIQLDQNKQPDDCDTHELETLLGPPPVMVH